MKVATPENIDTVLDAGRTHFAIDGEYAGSINTYNNLITKFGAWLAGKGVTILVNGEKLYVNTNSLRKFLSTNKIDFRSIEELAYRDLKSYQFQLHPSYGKYRFMASHISAATRDILSKDLFKAISLGDKSLALKKIRQGAELDTHAWFNEDTGQFFFRDYFAPALPHRPLDPQRFSQVTPFLLASRLHQVAVANLIREHNADLTLVGQTLIFNRELIDTQSHWHILPTKRYNYVEEVDRHGQKRTRVEPRLGVDVQTSETNVYLDRYEERYLMTFNPDTKQLDYHTQASMQTQWDTNNLTAILPIW